MVNYNEGKIYKIESTLGNMVYYGSTTKKRLCDRMTTHRGDYNKWLKGKSNLVMVYNLFEEYGLENCKIILVENCPCESRDELHAREAHYIRNFECVNKCIPNRTNKEYYEDNKVKIAEKAKVYREVNKDKIKEYREVNKDKILDKAKVYREVNKDKIKQYYEVNKDKRKQYYEVNKDKAKVYREVNKDKLLKYGKEYHEVNKERINEHYKEYYQNNKEQILEQQKIKYTCPCGSCIRKSDKSKHERTNKHITFINSQ